MFNEKDFKNEINIINEIIPEDWSPERFMIIDIFKDSKDVVDDKFQEVMTSI